jgi:hypothetical protein
MKLTKEQIEFLNKVCYSRKHWNLNSNGEVDVEGYADMRGMNLTEIPVKFGRISGYFSCGGNNLTTLKNCPDSIGSGMGFYCYSNNLKDYFKNTKQEDFPHWDRLNWGDVLEEYPFLINIGKKYIDNDDLKDILEDVPQTKLYLE